MKPSNIDSATGLPKGGFGIGTYSDGTRHFAGLVRSDGGVVELSESFHDTHVIFDDWERNFDYLVNVNANAHAAFSLDALRPLPPLGHPNLLCAASNYKQHVAEMMTKNACYQHLRRPGESDEGFFQRNYAYMEVRAREGMPYMWTALHSALVGANDDLLLPHIGEQHDWELELAVVVARSARHATPEEGKRMIAGYVMVNDIGSIDTARRTDIHFEFDWIGKNQPGFKIAGPFVVPSAFVPSLDDMHISLKLNGEVMQDWPTSDMIFKPGQFVAYASDRVRLMPGDVLLTGSPPGNGAHHGRFLKHDDVIDSEITFLGRQKNHCRREEIGTRKPAYPLSKNATQAGLLARTAGH